MERRLFPDSINPLADHPGLSLDPGKAVDPAQQLHLFFSLEMSGDTQKALEASVAAGKVISAADLKAKFQPDNTGTDALVKWLKDQGFDVTRVSPNGTGVYATASIATIEKSLQVEMITVTKDGKTYPAAKNAPSLPADLATSIHAIIGLQPYRQAYKHRRPQVPITGPLREPMIAAPIQTAQPIQAPPTPQPDPTPQPNQPTLPAQPAQSLPPPYFVSELLKAYNADTLGATGKGQTIAILIDTAPQISDLQAFWLKNKLTIDEKQITIINVQGQQLPPPDGEETMDAEWASGTAPGASIRVYAAGSLHFVDLDKALDTILADASSDPTLRQMSISIGLGETYIGGPEGQVAAEHQKFLRLAALGVNVFASSGDAGSNPDITGHKPGGPLQVEYAASDPSIIGVGGTSLKLSAEGSVSAETAWSAAGGGKSIIFPRPSWQTGNGVPPGTERLVPDVSLAADPNFGAHVIFNGVDQQIGGTSWSAPVWAGFCALMNEARIKAGKPALGFLNPLIYPLLDTPAFRNIISGCNGAYSAAAGYNCITGIGVPDIAALLAALNEA